MKTGVKELRTIYGQVKLYSQAVTSKYVDALIGHHLKRKVMDIPHEPIGRCVFIITSRRNGGIAEGKNSSGSANPMFIHIYVYSVGTFKKIRFQGEALGFDLIEIIPWKIALIERIASGAKLKITA
jgi:hypothetical protein